METTLVQISTSDRIRSADCLSLAATASTMFSINPDPPIAAQAPLSYCSPADTISQSSASARLPALMTPLQPCCRQSSYVRHGNHLLRQSARLAPFFCRRSRSPTTPSLAPCSNPTVAWRLLQRRSRRLGRFWVLKRRRQRRQRCGFGAFHFSPPHCRFCVRTQWRRGRLCAILWRRPDALRPATRRLLRARSSTDRLSSLWARRPYPHVRSRLGATPRPVLRGLWRQRGRLERREQLEAEEEARGDCRAAKSSEH